MIDSDGSILLISILDLKSLMA